MTDEEVAAHLDPAPELTAARAEIERLQHERDSIELELIRMAENVERLRTAMKRAITLLEDAWRDQAGHSDKRVSEAQDLLHAAYRDEQAAQTKPMAPIARGPGGIDIDDGDHVNRDGDC